ncbi:MAG: ABC transporter permease subunit [Hyphomicrobiales bacterium]|nr:ABC transporter permease subunit [Hyphomicrobiales bacterium]
MTRRTALVASPGVVPASDERILTLAVTLAVVLPLFSFFVLPLVAILSKSLATSDGIGFGNYLRIIGTRRFADLVINSVVMSGLASLITVALAFVFAYATQRCRLPGRELLTLIAMLPLFAPSLVQAQGLVLLLGRNGLLNRQFGFGIDIYGFWGVVIANVLYAFPFALLILAAALAVGDSRLYESARVMGAKPWRMFRTITLPGARYGLAAAFFVAFSLIMTDFGNAVVIGGDFNVLATEVYNQVIGQANFELGAVIGVVLLMPAILAQFVETRLSTRQVQAVSAQSRPLDIRPELVRDTAFGIVAFLIAGLILLVIGTVFFASFVRLWPYNMSFTVRHYAFDVQNGLAPLWTSIAVAFMAAILGTAMTSLAAIVVQKFPSRSTGLIVLLSLMSSAVPGMVLGLGYVLAFNNPANPLNPLYGTLVLIPILIVYYMHAQGFLITLTSLKQISNSFDEAATTLGASRLRTIMTVTMPLIWPSLVSVGVLFFMRAMVTLSAVIFIISPTTQVAAVSVLQLSDRGAVNQAAAFSVCIMAVVIGALLGLKLLLALCAVRDVRLIR